jgi:hypothetical protein
MGLNLGSVFGGGNILGLALNVASMAFPQLKLATALLGALSQGFQQGIQQGLGQAMQSLGLPKFIADMVSKALGQAFGGVQPNSAEQNQAAQGQPGQGQHEGQRQRGAAQLGRHRRGFRRCHAGLPRRCRRCGGRGSASGPGQGRGGGARCPNEPARRAPRAPTAPRRR